MRSVILAAGSVLVTACYCPAAPLSPDAAAINRLIKQLSDDSFKVREEASRKLKAYGETALDALAKATTNTDPEVSRRAKELIRAIEKNMNWEVRQFAGHDDQVMTVAFDREGRRCASGGFDKTIYIWDVLTGKALQKLEGHKDIVFSVSFSPDGNYLLSTSGGDRRNGKWLEGQDHTMRLWDLKTGKEVRQFGTPKDWVLCAEFSPNGKLAASGTRNADPTVRLWDPATGKEEKQLKGHTSGVRSVAFSPDGKTLATSGYDYTIRLWDVESGTELKVLRGHRNWIDRAVFAPDGKTLLSSSRDNTMRWWDIDQGKELRTFTAHTDHVLCVAFTPDGKRAVSSSGDRTVRVWDLKEGTERARLDGHTGAIDALAVSPDGRYALSGSHDKSVRLWKLPR
jgi:WD40 repeat protein